MAQAEHRCRQRRRASPRSAERLLPRPSRSSAAVPRRPPGCRRNVGATHPSLGASASDDLETGRRLRGAATSRVRPLHPDGASLRLPQGRASLRGAGQRRLLPAPAGKAGFSASLTPKPAKARLTILLLFHLVLGTTRFYFIYFSSHKHPPPWIPLSRVQCTLQTGLKDS